MAVTDASITTSTAGSFIPELWADETLDAAEFSAVLQKRVNRAFEKNLKVGNTLDIPRLSNLTTQSKSSGVGNTITFEAVTEGKQQITVSTHEYAAFLIEDVVGVQSSQDLRKKYTKKIGYALTRGREVTIGNLFQNLSQVIGTSGVELTADDYLAAYQKLMEAGLLEADMDPGEDFSIFLSPAAYVAALKVDVFINRQYNTAGDAIQRAKVGDIYGAGTFMSNLLRSPAAGQHDCAFIHRDCYALIVQEEIPVRSQWIIRNIADGVIGWNLYGAAEVNFPPETPGGGTAVDNRGVLLRTV